MNRLFSSQSLWQKLNDSATPKQGHAMDRTVADLNIQHFKKLLEAEKDEAKRQILLRLLAEEEAKLAAVSRKPGDPAKNG